MGQNFGLGSLEEDFRAIGLTGGAARSSGGSDVSDSLRSIEEGIAQRFSGGGKGRSRVLSQMTEGRAPQARGSAPQSRGVSDRQRKAVAESISRFNTAVRTPVTKPPVLSRVEGFDKINALVESVRGTVNELHSVRARDAVQGFANVAVIAETIGRRTLKIATRFNSKPLAESARIMGRLATVTGSIAQKLNARTESSFKSAKLNERFSQAMGVLTAGIGLYASLTEGPDAIAPVMPPKPAPAPGGLTGMSDEGMDPLADPTMGAGTPPASGVEGFDGGAADPNDPLGLGLGGAQQVPPVAPKKPGLEAMANGDRDPMANGATDIDLDGDLMDDEDPLAQGGDQDPLGM